MSEYIPRTLKTGLLRLAKWYPIVSVTGPRQSGKSTLVRNTFPHHRYLNLEDPATRSRALSDPSGFIANNPGPLIIDEAQYAPELFSAIQAAADASGQKGEYVLSGSQNFLMMRNIKQSLAGRVGIARLMPFSFAEIGQSQALSNSVSNVIFRGAYPQLWASDIPTSLFYENYIDTYVARDVMGYLDVRNESAFRLVMQLCATRAGNLLNISAIASDAGVSVPTVRNWLSILEASYVIFLLQPYYANIAKRLTKTPKLFFYDTGLLCHLLGIKTPDELVNSEAYGAVFENYVIAEQLKSYINHLTTPLLFFYRDDSKVEVDLVDTTNKPINFVEIKSGQTYRATFSRSVRKVATELPGDTQPCVVYGGEGTFTDNGVTVWGIREWLEAHQPDS